MKIHDIAILFYILGKHFTMCGSKDSGKTNLLYGTYASSPNLETEFGISPRGTVDLGAGFNWFTSVHSSSNKKLVHWLGSVEYRYWTCERFSGHFGEYIY